MKRKIGVLLLISAMVAIVLTLGLVGAGPAAADKGGCPNDAAANGATHANEKSAHGSEKQAARECSLGEPTPDPSSMPTPTVEPVPDPTPTPTPTVEPVPDPTPTPTPTPTDEADVQVVGVSVSTPIIKSFEEQFTVRVGASLLNAGPADTALVDTTFSFVVPSGCSVSPMGPITVEDSSLPAGVGVYISRGWIVTCVEPGTHEVTANVSVAIDPAQSASDPDPSNNTGSAIITLHVGS